MFIVGYFLLALAKLLSMVLSALYFILVARIIVSWLNLDPYNDIIRIIYRVTDPILVPLRRTLPLQVGMIDFSPIVAFMAIYFLDMFLVNVLYRLGQNLLS